jgi:hypothetical protein
MVRLKKKEKKAKPAAPKAAAKQAAPKPPKADVPSDVYTLFIGLAALCLITAVVVLGLNYYWYQTSDPAVIPMSWAK